MGDIVKTMSGKNIKTVVARLRADDKTRVASGQKALFRNVSDSHLKAATRHLAAK